MPLILIEIFTDINNEFIAEENNFWITRINSVVYELTALFEFIYEIFLYI